jgi:hypothetical protein
MFMIILLLIGIIKQLEFSSKNSWQKEEMESMLIVLELLQRLKQQNMK